MKIGEFLATLTPEEEGRVMGRKMEPERIRACLIGVAYNATSEGWSARVQRAVELFVGVSYNELCERFGTNRTNNAIRNRILRNQARRLLTPTPVEVMA